MDYEALLAAAMEAGASDLHLVPNAAPTIRVNGKIKPATGFDVCTYLDIQGFVDEILPEYFMQQLSETGEVSFSYSKFDLGRFRVNIVKQRGTLSIAIRILKLEIPSFETLGLPEAFIRQMDRGRGLLVVSGPSGSGKSTTIAALISEINQKHAYHIMTIESPIEYLYQHGSSTILQREVGVDCRTMTEGVLSAFHHDPDILVISNLRDETVIDYALQVAESGKLVIAGMNAVNTRTALEKLISGARPEHMASRKYKVSSSLLGILSQKLVPHIHEERRILSYELLIPNAAVKANIYENRWDDLPTVLISGQKDGMRYMDHSLFRLYQDGEISRDTMLKFSHDPDYIRRLEIAALR
ncbi:MAG: twitching motility protein PilT [Clostridiales bacterium]|jgi:twitching motility protein PilT|nr:twitching motility protein PilT [Clostridiales bacterium]MDN5299678.1 twitching motility protein PilT [Clostridiales bacterium]